MNADTTLELYEVKVQVPEVSGLASRPKTTMYTNMFWSATQPNQLRMGGQVAVFNEGLNKVGTMYIMGHHCNCWITQKLDYSLANQKDRIHSGWH